MIAAVTTTRDEADIIESTATHLLNGGVDLILAFDSSSDGTCEILRSLGAEVTHIAEPIHFQPLWMNRLAAAAYDHGAEWVVAWDADEYWLGIDRLHDLPENVATAELWHHRDAHFKYVPAERLRKVAFRPQPGAVIANGNHDVSIPGPRAEVLEIRHYQFRSFEHFKHKVRERSRTLDPAARARGDGSHMTRFEHASEDELLAAWTAHISQECVYDPIPTFHGSHRIGA